MRGQDLFVDLDGYRKELEREGNPLTALEGLPSHLKLKFAA